MKKSSINRLTVSTYAIVVPLYDYTSRGDRFLFAPCENEFCVGIWAVMKWNSNKEIFQTYGEFDDMHEAYNAAMELHNETLKKNEGNAHGGIDDEPMEDPFPEEDEEE